MRLSNTKTLFRNLALKNQYKPHSNLGPYKIKVTTSVRIYHTEYNAFNQMSIESNS